MPATLRDLFRKSGRPLERVLDLQHVVPGRRHVFGYYDDDVPTPRGTVLDLPMGSRADQQEELDSVLGAGTGAAWNAWLNALAPSWDVLRTRAIDRAFSGPKDLDRQDRRTLRPRLTLARAVRRKLSDERLTAMVIDRGRLGGQQPRTTPAFVAVADVIERSFGRWRIDGGDAALLSALVQRLAERRVDVRLGSPALDVVLADGQVSGVLLDRSVLAADLVVWAAPAPPPRSATPSPRCRYCAPHARCSCSARMRSRCRPKRWSTTTHRSGSPAITPVPTCDRRGRSSTPATKMCWRRWQSTASTSASRWKHGGTSPRSTWHVGPTAPHTAGSGPDGAPACSIPAWGRHVPDSSESASTPIRGRAWSRWRWVRRRWRPGSVRPDLLRRARRLRDRRRPAESPSSG
ncbi:MAG: FAD-dependent oxidoreductase [Nocardioidaceae bacterium]